MNKGKITRQVTLRAVYPVPKGADIMPNEQLLRKIAADIGNYLLREDMIKFEVVPEKDYDAVYVSLTVVTEPAK